MCHKIVKTKNNLYIKLLPDSYVGIKNFMLTEQHDLYSYYVENYFYNIKNRADENFLLIKVPKTLQDIVFEIGVITEEGVQEQTDIVGEIIAGSHISPITNTQLFIYERQVRCPVIFHSDKITFFDGSEISVSEFILPNPETMAKILNTLAGIKKNVKCYTENTVTEDIESIEIKDYLKLYTNFFENLLRKTGGYDGYVNF